MKKTIIALSAIAVTLFSVNVSAKTTDSFNAYTSKTEKKIEKIRADIPDGNAVAVIYNSDGKLFSVTPVKMKDKQCSIDIAYPDNNYTLRLYYDFGTDSFLRLTGDETKYNKDEETKPENPSDNGKDSEKDKNNGSTGTDISDNTNIAKIGTIAVVKESGKEYDKDSEQVISYLDVLYNNKEIRIKLEEDYKIYDAAESLSYMRGKSVSELKCGDVLSLSANLSGRLNGIKLVFRAPVSDPAADASGSSVFDLTDDDEMFGLIQNKIDSRFIVLYDNKGKAADSQVVFIEPDTPVYIYDMSKKKDNLRIGTVSEIYKSEIPSADYDNNENIIKWSAGCTHNYAFVNSFNGGICDIVIYENYELKEV